MRGLSRVFQFSNNWPHILFARVSVRRQFEVAAHEQEEQKHEITEHFPTRNQVQKDLKRQFKATESTAFVILRYICIRIVSVPSSYQRSQTHNIAVSSYFS